MGKEGTQGIYDDYQFRRKKSWTRGRQFLNMQKEDVAFDMECYEDSEGHRYDFGFGMNFEGIIMDERSSRYQKNR